MKKIEKRMGQIIISVVVLLILFISIVLVRQYFQYREATFNYNGFEVQKLHDKAGEFYRIKVFVNENKVPTSVNTIHNPKNLENIPININKESLLHRKEIFIVIDPYANLTGKTVAAALEINKFIDNPYLFNIPVSSAFTKSWKNQTVKTCNDVTKTTGIIILELGDETKIYEDNCIKIEGKTQNDLVRAADRLSLTLLGVMKS